MALRFETVGTCLIVKQYLDRSRQILRQELMGKVSTLFREYSLSESLTPNELELPSLEIPRVRSV